MAGDVETGVTIHRDREGARRGTDRRAGGRSSIEEDDDAGDVYARAAELAAELLDEVLADPDREFGPQPERASTYAAKIDAGRPDPRSRAAGARARRHASARSRRTSARAPSCTAGR